MTSIQVADDTFVAADPAPQADGVAGRYNNVDLAYGLRVGGETIWPVPPLAPAFQPT